MTDEIDALLARARRLEEDNALLRSLQSPGGDQDALQAETVLLRRELDRLGPAPDEAQQPPETGEPPGTLAEFNALPAARRRALAQRMTRRQRDELLGRDASPADHLNYL